MERDPTRTPRYNRVINAFNMLARYLERQGKSTSWRKTLGDENENSGLEFCLLSCFCGKSECEIGYDFLKRYKQRKFKYG